MYHRGRNSSYCTEEIISKKQSTHSARRQGGGLGHWPPFRAILTAHASLGMHSTPPA